MELCPVAFVELADAIADLGTEDGLERGLFHSDHVDVCPLYWNASTIVLRGKRRRERTFDAAMATSIPMNELPTTTNFFFSPSPLPIASLIFLTSSISLRV